MVVFVDQMSELLDLALEKYHSLSEVQREELAAYIIPEVSGGPMYIQPEHLRMSLDHVLILAVYNNYYSIRIATNF